MCRCDLRRYFNPEKRLSAEDALPSSAKDKDGRSLSCHPYVAKFHDPANEPVRPPRRPVRPFKRPVLSCPSSAVNMVYLWHGAAGLLVGVSEKIVAAACDVDCCALLDRLCLCLYRCCQSPCGFLSMTTQSFRLRSIVTSYMARLSDGGERRARSVEDLRRDSAAQRRRKVPVVGQLVAVAARQLRAASLRPSSDSGV